MTLEDMKKAAELVLDYNDKVGYLKRALERENKDEALAGCHFCLEDIRVLVFLGVEKAKEKRLRIEGEIKPAIEKGDWVIARGLLPKLYDPPFDPLEEEWKEIVKLGRQWIRGEI